jgi:hypothetical protein
MRRNKVGILSIAAVVALGGCSDSTEPEMDPLTEAEATQIASFLMTQSVGSTAMPVGFQELAARGPGNRLLALARVDFDETVTETVACPLGGSVEVTASVEGFADDETGVFEVDANQTQVYTGCVGEGESGDFTFTLDSAPSVTSDFFIGMDAQENLTALGYMMGTLDWSAGDRSGRCEIDFQFELATEGQNLTLSTSGVVCNVTVEQNVSITG